MALLTASLSGALLCLVVALQGLGVLGFVSSLLLSCACQQSFLGTRTIFGYSGNQLTSAGPTALSHRGCCPSQMHRSDQRRSSWQSCWQVLASAQDVGPALIRCRPPIGLPTVIVIAHNALVCIFAVGPL